MARDRAYGSVPGNGRAKARGNLKGASDSIGSNRATSAGRLSRTVCPLCRGSTYSERPTSTTRKNLLEVLSYLFAALVPHSHFVRMTSDVVYLS